MEAICCGCGLGQMRDRISYTPPHIYHVVGVAWGRLGPQRGTPDPDFKPGVEPGFSSEPESNRRRRKWWRQGLWRCDWGGVWDELGWGGIRVRVRLGRLVC